MENLVAAIDQLHSRILAYLDKVSAVEAEGKRLLSTKNAQDLLSLKGLMEKNPVLSEGLPEWQQLKKEFLALAEKAENLVALSNGTPPTDGVRQGH